MNSTVRSSQLRNRRPPDQTLGMMLRRALARFFRREIRSAARDASSETLKRVLEKVEADRNVEDPAKGPVLVYQFGKVASKTVTETIAKLAPQCEVIHVHGLTSQFWSRMQEYGEGNNDGASFLRVCRQLEGESAELRLRIEATRGVPPSERRWKWRVVTITREPMALTLSGLFHLAEHVIPSFSKPGHHHSAGVERIHQALTRQIAAYGAEDPGEPTDFLERACRASFRQMEEWFDYELKGVFGNDVYAEPFDRDRGYSIIRNDFAEVLILRFEGLFDVLDEALAAFVGGSADTAKASRSDRNKTNNKGYGDAYQDYLKALKLPADFLSRRYDTRYTKHFYGPEEIAGFQRRWSGVT